MVLVVVPEQDVPKVIGWKRDIEEVRTAGEKDAKGCGPDDGRPLPGC